MNRIKRRETRRIEQTLLDLHEICTKNDIQYRVIGSTAYVSAVNNIYRIPHDVDFLFDDSKKEILHRELLKRGYQHIYQKFPLPVLARPLTHYIKRKMFLEPRGVVFTDRGFEFPLLLPLLFISKKKWPLIKLVFSPTMIKPVTYKFGKATYTGLSREALWMGLNIFMKVISVLEDKTSKRTIDLRKLSEKLDKSILDQIKKENPGIYYKNFSLATPAHTQIISFISLIVKVRKFISGS